MPPERVGICVLYPELLGTYGDGGNAVVLAQRLQWRGIDAEIVDVRGGDPAPDSCDVYLMGGGEDGPQALAATELLASRALHRAVDRGAVVLAVCAGFQLLGHEFLGAEAPHPGLGLLDARTDRRTSPRRVGELVARPDPALGLPALTGYENHAGMTALGAGAQPLGRVVHGFGNDGSGVEGAVADRVVGTYLHGPALARNAALADLLLSWVVGPLPPVDDHEVAALRQERLAAAGRDSRRRHLLAWRR